MIITIDGPIATGKSSIAKRLAEKLGDSPISIQERCIVASPTVYSNTKSHR